MTLSSAVAAAPIRSPVCVTPAVAHGQSSDPNLGTQNKTWHVRFVSIERIADADDFDPLCDDRDEDSEERRTYCFYVDEACKRTPVVTFVVSRLTADPEPYRAARLRLCRPCCCVFPLRQCMLHVGSDCGL